MVRLDLNLLILAKDARSHYDAYMELSEKQKFLRNATRQKFKAFQVEAEATNKRNFFIGHDIDLSMPAFMCLAFSLELHIKLLLKIHGIKKHGHEILKLVKALPQKEIDILSQSKHLYPMHQGENFFPELLMLRKFFNRVRYYFEDLSTLKLSPWFSLGLIKAIQERVSELAPQLSYELGLLEKA